MDNAIKAILFDLDGTLLDVDMLGVFLPRYFEALTASLAHLVPPERFMPALMQASQEMQANDGRDTNERLFAQAFYSLVDCSPQAFESAGADFYAHGFPKLRRYTRRDPLAREVVQIVFDQGLDVVIATNPLFPATAIRQRMAWADVADFPYRLVTTYENSRAAKPNLLYYEGLLEHLGHPASACLMVGDEDMDMVAAHLGCPTFLLPGPCTELAPTTPEPTFCGSLADLKALLKN